MADFVFNNRTDVPGSFTVQDSSAAPNIVRLIEDPDVKKRIQFDEISITEVKVEDEQNVNKQESTIGMSFPIMRINDLVIPKINISSVTISQKSFMPTISVTLIFEDKTFISKNMPKDGDILSLFIRTSTNAVQYLRDEFIITSCSTSSKSYGESGTSIFLSGRLFVPGFDSRQATNSVIGTSKSVIRAIAEGHGMGFAFNDYDDTNDYQMWIQCKESQESFITFITKHAWKNNTSFFKSWVDLYYNICYVNVNKFLLAEENEEAVDVTFATKAIDAVNLMQDESSVENATAMVKFLSNAGEFKNTPFYIKKWSPVNNSTSVSMGTGYTTRTYSFIHNQDILNDYNEDSFIKLENIPAYDPSKTDKAIILRGRAKYDSDKNPETEMKRVNYDFVNTYNREIWTGVEYVLSDADKNRRPLEWHGNVHKNFNNAPYHNSQNLSELDKMYLEVECEGLNLQVLRGERIPVYIVSQNTMESKRNEEFSDNDKKDGDNTNRLYTGYYIVDSIEYKYGLRNEYEPSPYTTKFILKRREWPTPETI